MNTLAYVPFPDPKRVASLSVELLTLNAHLNAANSRFLGLVREFDACMGWAEDGARSMAHWLNWRCGIALGAAREQVRVAHALTGLPQTAELFAAGKLSYSKVRALSRVATTETEGFFLNVAEYGTALHLEKTVRLVRQGLALEDLERQRGMTEAVSCTWYYDDDGMLVFHARLMPDHGARLVKALQTLEGHDKDVPLAVRRARALVEVAEAAVAGDGATVPEIVVHLRAKDVSAETSASIEDQVVVPQATVERLCCDAAIVPLREDARGEPLSIGRRGRTIPPAIRRALNARDAGCQFPGCTHTRFLHAHHVLHWARGGETAVSNLLNLCSYHHTLVHEGGFAITHQGDGRFGFTNPNGKPLTAKTPAPPSEANALENANAAAGIDVSAETSESKWDGRHPDYDCILTAFFYGARKRDAPR